MPKPKILIVVDGGVVQSVSADSPVDVQLIDYDNLRAGGGERLTELYPVTDYAIALKEVSDYLDSRGPIAVLGPDGIPLTPKPFPRQSAAEHFVATWIEQYRQQGYYSSPEYGRIPLDALNGCLDFQRA